MAHGSGAVRPPSEKAAKTRTLLAFDFDHTLVEENTDVFVLQLLGGEELPQEIQAQKQTFGWTRYMGAIFVHLHNRGITGKAIRDHMERTPLVPGMTDLFAYIRMNPEIYDCIIISDSNSLFIWYILHYARLEDVFPTSSIYTNPARLDESDCLHLDYYHHNTTCRLSSLNLCKGRVLQEHIERVQRERGIIYQTVLFTGDGLNDFCPSTRLRATDYVAARRGFKLWDKINQDPSKVAAGVVPWTDGNDLLTFIRNLHKCH